MFNGGLEMMSLCDDVCWCVYVRK